MGKNCLAFAAAKIAARITVAVEYVCLTAFLRMFSLRTRYRRRLRLSITLDREKQRSGLVYVQWLQNGCRGQMLLEVKLQTSDLNCPHVSILWSRFVSVPLGRHRTSSSRGTSPSPRNQALALPACKTVVQLSDITAKLNVSYGGV